MDITRIVYDLSLDTSWLDDEFGCMESAYGWNGLIIGNRYIFIIHVDNYGNKTVNAYDKPERQIILDAWHKDCQDYHLEYGKENN